MPTNICPVHARNMSPHRDELDKLYKRKCQSVNNEGLIQYVKQLIDNQGGIVLNLDFDILHHIIVGLGHYENLYERYENIYERSANKDYPELDSLPEKISLEKNDKHSTRIQVDDCLFGVCKKHIYYAALSLNEWGLSSYGPCTIRFITKKLIEQCVVSLLIENSFRFIEEYPCSGSSYPPAGYSAGWQDGYKLVVVKLAKLGLQNMTTEQIPSLLLVDAYEKAKAEGREESKDESKMKDEFIEIHICGRLTSELVESAGLMVEEEKIEELITSKNHQNRQNLLKDYPIKINAIKERLKGKLYYYGNNRTTK